MSVPYLPTVQPEVGLGVLHLFGKVTDKFDSDEMERVIKRATQFGRKTVELKLPEGSVNADFPRTQIITVEILGHKADLGFMILDFDLWRIRKIQTALGKCGIAWQNSYVSLTEISEYAKGVPEAMQQARLYPDLPPKDKSAWCFYPMSKRRGEVNNWFRETYDERLRMMHEHGASGRKFSGRVLQIITGSTGLDEYEWGVTLFCSRPEDLKEVVYTMRYDEASALYGEFGDFWTGMVIPPEAIGARFSPLSDLIESL